MKQIDKNIDINELIAGYFANELSPEENICLFDWLKSSPANKKYFQQQREIWFSSVVSNNQIRFDHAKAFQLFLNRKAIAIQKQVSSKRRIPLIFQRVAAAVLLLIIAGSGYWLGIGQMKNLITENVIIEAPLGSRSKMQLPDGTTVWLNAGSTLSYPQNFGVSERVVNIKGEGYFEVTHMHNKPFKVVSNDLKVRVLGTKFNLRNYMDEEEAKVTLLEGSVKVNCSTSFEKEAHLKPNQQIVYDRRTKSSKITATNASNSLEWTNGYLFFDEEKLTDIARELERSYNVRIRIADESLKSYRFYGNFTRTNQTIQEVLEVLASTERLKYEINGKEITLKEN